MIKHIIVKLVEPLRTRKAKLMTITSHSKTLIKAFRNSSAEDFFEWYSENGAQVGSFPWKAKLPGELKKKIASKLRKCSRPPKVHGKLPRGWIARKSWKPFSKIKFYCDKGETKKSLRQEAKAKYYGYGIHTPPEVGKDILNLLGKTDDPDIVDLIECEIEDEANHTKIMTLAREILERHWGFCFRVCRWCNRYRSPPVGHSARSK